MEIICIKCQILFSGKNKKNIINLLSAELAQRVIKVNMVCSINQGDSELSILNGPSCWVLCLGF